MEKYAVFTGKLKDVKIAVLSKFIHCFKAILIKIPAGIFNKKFTC